LSDPIGRLPGLSVFFPAKNEAENIETVVRDALRILPGIADRFDVTVVDDGSTDDTGEIADRLAREDPRSGSSTTRRIGAMAALSAAACSPRPSRTSSTPTAISSSTWLIFPASSRASTALMSWPATG
jgi:glycosyltransferase involved in cell wall biosynthesis